MIQRRLDGSTDFYRNWTEYENGFGNVYADFWLGECLSSYIPEFTTTVCLSIYQVAGTPVYRAGPQYTVYWDIAWWDKCLLAWRLQYCSILYSFTIALVGCPGQWNVAFNACTLKQLLYVTCPANYYLWRVQTTTICDVYRQQLSVTCTGNYYYLLRVQTTTICDVYRQLLYVTCTDNYYLWRVQTTTIRYVYRQLLYVMCTDDYYLLLCTDNYYLLRVHTTTICYVYRQLLSVMCFHSPAITTCYVYTIRQLLSAMYTHSSNYYMLRVHTGATTICYASAHWSNYYLLRVHTQATTIWQCWRKPSSLKWQTGSTTQRTLSTRASWWARRPQTTRSAL